MAVSWLITNYLLAGMAFQAAATTETRAMGVEWERLNAFVPLERRLWEEAAKPPQGTPILGGDMAPP